MANRYVVTAQGTLTNGTGTATGSPIDLPTGNTVVAVTILGTFTVFLASGTSGTATSGTCTITGSPVALVAGSNSITTTTATGNITINLATTNAANWNTVNTFSATSGGLAGASVPGATDNVFLDANSFPAASMVLTIDAAASCLDMDWTGATNTPTLAGSQNLTISGNFTTIAAMNITMTGINILSAGAAAKTWTIIPSITVALYLAATGGVTLGAALTSTAQIYVISGGAFNTGNYNVTCGYFGDNASATAKTVTLGSSVITCTAWRFEGAGALTLTANTATIKVSGTGAFSGGGAATYNEVQLNGSAHTISGSNKFANLILSSSATQTITFTDGTTQTVSSVSLSGDATHIHTLTGSAAAGWNIYKPSGMPVVAIYIAISYSNALPGFGIWFAPFSTNSGNNTGWQFRQPGVAGMLGSFSLLQNERMRKQGNA